MTLLDNKKIIIASILVASAALVFSFSNQTEILADKDVEPSYNFANGISVHTVFKFHDGQETTDAFQVFKQKFGFDRSSSSVFELEGLVNTDTPMLYEAADEAAKYGKLADHYAYREFNVDVYLHQDGETLRQFSYSSCRVSDYKVDTLFDKEEGWHGKGFAVVDEFEFTCKGYTPQNTLYYDLEKINGYSVDSSSESSNELENEATWEDHPKFNN